MATRILQNPVPVFVFSSFYFLFCLVFSCQAANNITSGQSLKDGQSLVSIDGRFTLGFFSPGNSTSRYLGIWYTVDQNQSAAVWVANRETGISGNNGSMTIGQNGNLNVLDGNGAPVWSSDVSDVASNNTAAILDTTGNLILSSTANSNYWQSFDHPTSTYLPSMRALASGDQEVRIFTSWKSANDPSQGSFTMGVDPRGGPQIVIWENSTRKWRSGQWNAQIFTGVPEMITLTNYQYGFKFITEADGKSYFTYNPSNASDLMMFDVTWEGYEEQKKWNFTEDMWHLIQAKPSQDCEKYNFCGNFGVCTETDNPKCTCMDGFMPRNPEQWRMGNWSGGCHRRTQLQCQVNTSVAADGFKQLRCLKLPDFANVVTGITFDVCNNRCLQNCSCSAFALVNGIGCMMWSGDLIDIQNFEKVGSSLYLRLADSELDHKNLSTLVIAIIVVSCVIFVAILILLLWKLKKKLKVLPTISPNSFSGMSDMPHSDMSKTQGYSTDYSGPADLIVEASQVNAPDLRMFSFGIVAAATDNFSEKNKLGQGGFGHVYKGKLPGGEYIAVKRLSRVSGQGLEEFKNEITLIAKLQHRNLVRLLGCCIQGEEKMLIYEYMPNKSLDFFIFDTANQALLDWKKRFEIIEGIARGLLYLHRDSRLRIIHRDLKASNILLDEEMIPKISDFGMAKIFGGNQNEANTNRVVGTYGYMSPEYAMEGLFSVKSDVYSFGVLVLEIVSGRKNTSFRLSDHMNLIAYAWEYWSEGKAMELVDPAIRNSCSQDEVLKCIQVGMLCVQDSALHRPTMASVMLMLESDNPSLPLPRQPTFRSMRASIDTEIYTEYQEIVSSNDLTVTMVVGR